MNLVLTATDPQRGRIFLFDFPFRLQGFHHIVFQNNFHANHWVYPPCTNTQLWGVYFGWMRLSADTVPSAKACWGDTARIFPMQVQGSTPWLGKPRYSAHPWILSRLIFLKEEAQRARIAFCPVSERLSVWSLYAEHQPVMVWTPVSGVALYVWQCD